MLILITGTPGASKTLNAIKFVNEDPLFAVTDDNGKPTSARRPVYYFNIKELKLPWTKLSIDEALKWYELPKGSVIIFDEAYDVFPQRLRGEPPAQVKKLATHRHYGHDIIIITQKVTGQIDSFVRGLIGRHIHLERRFGTTMVTRLEWQKCCENVNDYHQKKEALSKNIKIDKKYFGSYHSAEVHTVKSNLPWGKLIGLGVMVLAAIGLMSFAFFHMSNMVGGSDDEGLVTTEQLDSLPGMAKVVDSVPRGSVDKIAYLERFVPRVSGLPHTAPAYDELTKPKTYPKPSCMSWRWKDGGGDCRCLSQQGTRLDIPLAMCEKIVKYGYFDPAKEDESDKAQRFQREEMRTRVALDTSAKYGGDPIDDVKRLNNTDQFTSIGDVRPYDHFFAGTDQKSIPSSR